MRKQDFKDDLENQEIIRILEKGFQKQILDELLQKEYQKRRLSRTEKDYDEEDIERRDWEGQDNMQQFLCHHGEQKQ